MSNFLTPSGKPFFAGTYFPPANFFTLLQQIAGAWRERREDVENLRRADASSVLLLDTSEGRFVDETLSLFLVRDDHVDNIPS